MPSALPLIGTLRADRGEGSMVTRLRDADAATSAGIDSDEAATSLPRRPGRRPAVVAVALLLGIAAVASPFASVTLMAIPGYMTAFGASMIVINILLAALLFSKGAIEGRGDATRLGTAYLFVALIFMPMVVCFPGGLMEHQVIGTMMSSLWLWSFWHAGFGLLVIRYALLARQSGRPTASLRATIAVAAVVVAGLSVLAITVLPATLPADGGLFSGLYGLNPLVIMAILLTALVMVCRLRASTPEQMWLAVAMVGMLVDVWLTYLGSNRFSIGWYLSKSASMFTSLVVLITLFYEVVLLQSRAAAANSVLASLANLDGLTGLCNRRRLDELVNTEWRRGAREQQPLSMLMIDVDFFKKYNDTFGHPAGDDCLRGIAAMLRSVAARPSDKVGRYGGEEFVMLLPSTDAAGAVEVARRVRIAIRKLAFLPNDNTQGSVTLSVGMATILPNLSVSPEQLVLEADRALYRAKRAGRDRACWADDREIPVGQDILASLVRTSDRHLTTALGVSHRSA